MFNSANPKYTEAERFLKQYFQRNSDLQERSDSILGKEIKADIVISEISEKFVEAYSKMGEFRQHIQPEYYSLIPQIKNNSLVLEAHPEKIDIGVKLSLSIRIGVYKPKVILEVPEASLIPETFKNALDLSYASGEESSRNYFSMKKYNTLEDFNPKEAALEAKDKLNKVTTFLRKSTRIDLNTS